MEQVIHGKETRSKMSDSVIQPIFAPYRPEDLAEVLEFTGECSRLSNFANLHPGDIAHSMSNTFRGRNLSSHFGLYRHGESGKIVALNILTGPPNPFLDLILHPHYRESRLEADLFKDTQRRLLEQLQGDTPASANIKVGSSLYSGDDARRDLLDTLGYVREPDSLDYLSARSLQEYIPEPELPEGFTIRSVAGEHEVGAVIKVHNGSFGSRWTEDSYLDVMRTPGFEIGREMVVVAPRSGAEDAPIFAAFCIYWLDPASRSGLFEPVGCHVDFQRKGLTRALTYATMQRMKTAGMETTQVFYHGNNDAARKLYLSVGFRPIHDVYEYYASFE
jgi:ribosomal protein S18 acetylase RimI-like enzyme